ncbi:MAG: SH3 domain-containing protein [Leptolyngbyaceae cyanobacterium SM1_3_5]|nr:SH3 domain-containing protein [Leptolyngbyaceae cyanobacterium SM1_3_5]
MTSSNSPLRENSRPLESPLSQARRSLQPDLTASQPRSLLRSSALRSRQVGQPLYQFESARPVFDRWNASFINRTASNLTNYSSYDFSRANAVKDLGAQRGGAGTVAQLVARFGRNSPDSAIQKDRFAMQAWTRVQLEAGKFYRLSSRSDDGTRFFFRDAQSGRTLTTLNGDWRDRNTRNSLWNQVVNVAQSGEYDFFVQYYENTGRATVDVKLESFAPAAQIVSTSGLNLRSKPSTLGNRPIKLLPTGTTISIDRSVQSPDDSRNRDWYQVTTSDGQRGFVAAGSDFVQLATTATVIDRGTLNNPTNPIDNGGSIGIGAGIVGRKVLLTSSDRISLRADKDVAGTQITTLGLNAPVTILEKVTGGYYLNRFDQWYKVRVTENGQSKEGFIAAFYVDANTSDGRFQTAISASNPFFRPHLNELMNPTYSSSSYKPFIESMTAKYAWLKPSIVAGIGSRESAWGLALSPKGPGGTGDRGHGRGLMQIDDRYHKEFINSGLWRNPQENIRYAIDQVLARNYDHLLRNSNLRGIDLLRGAIAAYNSGLTSVKNAIAQGLDVDHFTTGQDYSWDVLNRAGWFQLNGWN